MFGNMGIGGQPSLDLPEISTPAVAVPQMQAPEVDTSFAGHFTDFMDKPGFTEGMLAFGSVLMGGGNIADAGMQMVGALTKASDKETLKEQHETQKRLLALQQSKENAYTERDIKRKELIAGETIVSGKHARDMAEETLEDKKVRTDILREAETRLSTRSSADIMKDFTIMKKLDAETAKLNAETNIPPRVNAKLWDSALKTAKASAPTNQFGESMEVPVSDVLKVYNDLSGKPIHLSLDSATLKDLVETTASDMQINPNALEEKTAEIEDTYGPKAAKRFAAAAARKAKTTAKPREVSIMESVFGG